MITRKMSIVAAAVAMAALAPAVARADSSTTTTSTTTTEFVPIDIVTITPPPLGPNGEMIDYSVLSTRNFDYVDLNQARAEGFNDHDIAVMAKISDKAGVPFSDIKQLALNGMAYPTIADKFGLNAPDAWKTDEYERKIAMYRVAYETTGEKSVHNLVAASEQEYIPAKTSYTTTTTTTTTASPSSNLADVINSAPELTMFARALRQAGLMSLLNGSGQYTIFAPTDSAFAKLSTDQVNALMNNTAQLVKVLDYHIIPQRIDAATAMAMTSPTSPATVEGDPLQVTNSNGSLFINGAGVVKSDIPASNGVVQEIDTVLMPPSVNTITNTTTTVSPSTTISPNSTTTVDPNGTTTTTTPNGTTTVQPDGTTTVQPAP